MKIVPYLITTLITGVMISSCSFFSQENTQDDKPIVEANVTGQFPEDEQAGMSDRGMVGSSSVSSGANTSLVRVKPTKPGRKVFGAAMNGPYVALTFDDGPHPVNTPRILDILNKYGAKATFYVLGERVQRHPSILARAVASGHEIGVHTWDHPSLTSISRDAVKSQMDRSITAINSATGGRKIRTMRPPYGAINTGLVDYFASEYGLTTVMWNVDTNDWRRPGVSVVTSRAVNSAKSGSIILLHDIHSPSADAVEGIVKGLQARGFQLVTVGELLYRAYLESKQEEQTSAQEGVAAATPSVAAPAQPQAQALAPEYGMSATPEVESMGQTAPQASSAPSYTAPEVVAPGMSGAY